MIEFTGKEKNDKTSEKFWDIIGLCFRDALITQKSEKQEETIKEQDESNGMGRISELKGINHGSTHSLSSEHNTVERNCIKFKI